MLRYFAVALCLQPQYAVSLFLLAVLFKEALLTKLDLLCNNCATYIADDLVSTIDYTKAIEALCKVAEKYTPEKAGKLSGSESNERNNNSSSNIEKRKGKAVKGISQSLLAKVREKEAQQKLKSMIRSDIDEKKIEKLKQLPDVAKSLRTLFVSEKKGSLSMVYLSSKLAKCCPFVATSALMEDHLRLLADVTAPWLSFTTVRKQEYARLDKDVQISVVLAKLQNQIKLEEKS
ncbi:unnamed protein product [Clavelina lepadiformis]|uniref:DNA replication factor Cdt1 C-terminal domain-containing protein n=1 Tax=Clavelina lepadiformis TaxID=159417 RepID=A0ABP0H060_CLALP